MKDDRRKFEEFAELAARGKEHLLHHLGQSPKPARGLPYSIPIPVARSSDLGSAAAARAEALSSIFRQWLLEHRADEARPETGNNGGRPIIPHPYGIST